MTFKGANTEYDLAVAYRIYPGISKHALPFGENKLRLAEICLRSFRASLGKLRAKVWVILDSCPPEYGELFKRYFDEIDLQLIHVDKAGNPRTFKMQLKILSEQDAAELVYFAEDDYMYLPNQFEEMVHLLRAAGDVDFVTPYDHPDYYALDLEDHRCRIRLSGSRHWRTAGSTCLTFLTARSTLRRTRPVFETFLRDNFDSSLWLSLTKSRVLNFGAISRYVFSNWPLLKILIKAWLYCWPQILFGKRWRLWSPIPTIATHLDARLLARGVVWDDYVKRDLPGPSTD